MADTNASLDFSIVYVNNPKVLLNQKPYGWEPSEKPDECYVAPQGHGAFNNLKGVHKILGKVQVVSKMIAGKGNSPVEVLGEDVRENSYASKIAGIAARLDGQIEEEAARIGKRPELLGWSYERNGSDGEYVSVFSKIGVTDERVRGSEAVPMSVDEKADKVWGVQAFGGLMDIAGGRNHFRHEHWLFGEKVEVREEKRVFVSRPIMPLPAPIRKSAGKFVVAFDEKGKVVARSVDAPRRVNRNIKMLGDIEKLMSLLSSEPQFAGEIAKKAGMEPKQVSKILKAAFNAGFKVQISKKKDAARRMVPAFSL